MSADPLLARILADCKLSASAGGSMPIRIVVKDDAERAHGLALIKGRRNNQRVSFCDRGRDRRRDRGAAAHLAPPPGAPGSGLMGDVVPFLHALYRGEAAMPAIDDDVLRELRYCLATPGSRFLKGQVAAAQDAALELGLLAPDRLYPNLLAITERGRRVLLAADEIERR